MSDNDDVPTLPADTLAILQQFYADKEKKTELLTSETDNLTTELFEEDWQLSQFWYDEETVRSLVKVVNEFIPSNGSVGLISCPTLFTPILKSLSTEHTVKLFEFDQRFAVYGSNFISYDFNRPLDVPNDFNKYFDIVIADPPFLSDDCFTKTSETIKYLSKDKIIICTGAIMNECVTKLLNLNRCKFQPRHTNNLANEFSCYANFDLDSVLK